MIWIGFLCGLASLSSPVENLGAARWLLSPAVDMYQTKDAVVVKSSLPGVKPEDVEISVTGDTLAIKGEMKEEKETKEEYYYKEHSYGTFSRSVGLPSSLKTDKAEAVFEDGVLTLTIPKAEEIKPKTIKVGTKKVIEGKNHDTHWRSASPFQLKKGLGTKSPAPFSHIKLYIARISYTRLHGHHEEREYRQSTVSFRTCFGIHVGW